MIIQKEQFTIYIKQYERLIITICLAFTKNYFDAEDLAQQTFLSAYSKYGQIAIILIIALSFFAMGMAGMEFIITHFSEFRAIL